MEIHTKREIAEQILSELFAEQTRVTIAEAVETGRERGVSRRLLTRVAREQDIRTISNGPFGAFWEKP